MEEASSSSSSCTVTQRLQAELESVVGSLYEAFDSATSKERAVLLGLHRDEHEEYVTRGLRRLSVGYCILDSSRPWLCYWILHSLALIGRSIDDDLYDRTVDFLKHCQDVDGGYAGGPGQMPHLATTYAATCALVTLGGEKALSSVNREKILQFLLRMKDPCGGFRVHEDGEMDMRGSFTALAVAHLLDIMVPELVDNVGEYVRSCQTYEGGIGGEPGAEAHGGYTYCGLAALALINELHVLDLPSLVNWVAFRQGKVEGGFQGRTNKLVDGCYSFWQGGCFWVLQQQMQHLWAQQTSLVAALHMPQDGFKVTSNGPLNTKDMERHGLIDSDSEARDFIFKRGSTESVSCEVQGDNTKQGVQTSSAPAKEKCTLPAEDSLDVEETQGSHAGIEKLSPLVHGTKKIGRGTKSESVSKDVPSKHSISVGNEAGFWDSDSKAYGIAAEKLFPGTDAIYEQVPLHAKTVELVDLADDQQDWQAGVSGISTNASGSLSDLDGCDDTLSGQLFNSQALQAYILLCCQDLDGGLRDKPGKPCDYYHTCYCLSGLAVAQHSTAHRVGAPPPPSMVVGPYGNLVEATTVLCNVRLDRYYEAQSFFKHFKEL